MPRCGLCLLGWGLLASLTLAPTASAQEAVAAEAPVASRAEALFEAGIASADRGDWSGAAERFRASLAANASDRTAFNLARALTALGEVSEAASLLRAIVEEPGSDLLIRDAARMLLDEISPLLAVRPVTAPSPRDAAHASVTGVAPASLAEPVEDDSRAITDNWWFWTGAGALVVGAVIVGVLIATGGPDPAQGDVDPIYLGDAR